MIQRRAVGRPRSFSPEAALDRAVVSFWKRGFDGTDLDSIAREIGVTKPSLYRIFGDKASLFLLALHRYNATYGQKALAAFQAEPDIARAVTYFLEITVKLGTMKGYPTGCLMACVAAGQAARSIQVRKYYAGGLAQLTDALAKRFQREQEAGNISTRLPAIARAQLLTDAVQGIAIRARAGVSRRELLNSVQHYVRALID
ncbi:TetR/AcrR family transcriptional regulator [Burkholderia cenocepacia]|uniref:TetR/AcrR family transcriptional regulator n=1 Tax=Burkholderia cenocepacia TaxID=95486 RepID=UPI0028564318|nr:TetR/AcrR family transcriptional regulator [Burkholderia cenocepacia]MDR5644423.1 TetR/AcrR family transcriptional regulator [Burkholderia cenocepacia]